MKRSEMVNILEKAINSNLYQDYLFDEEMISEVLDTIEQAGMLPPRTKLGTLGIEDNAWEPEDV